MRVEMIKACFSATFPSTVAADADDVCFCVHGPQLQRKLLLFLTISQSCSSTRALGLFTVLQSPFLKCTRVESSTAALTMPLCSWSCRLPATLLMISH
jgi:hypothetical protein